MLNWIFATKWNITNYLQLFIFIITFLLLLLLISSNFYFLKYRTNAVIGAFNLFCVVVAVSLQSTVLDVVEKTNLCPQLPFVSAVWPSVVHSASPIPMMICSYEILSKIIESYSSSNVIKKIIQLSQCLTFTRIIVKSNCRLLLSLVVIIRIE